MLFFVLREQKVLTRTKIEPVSKERSVLFEYKYHITITSLFQQNQELRPLLNFCLFFIVAKIFLLTGLSILRFVIWKCKNTTVHDTTIIQFTFFLFMVLQIIIAARGTSFIVMLVPCFLSFTLFTIDAFKAGYGLGG